MTQTMHYGGVIAGSGIRFPAWRERMAWSSGHPYDQADQGARAADPPLRTSRRPELPGMLCRFAGHQKDFARQVHSINSMAGAINDTSITIRPGGLILWSPDKLTILTIK